MIQPSDRLRAASAPRVLFSGGGSAGHLAPGFALADALGARGFDAVFATPGEHGERDWFAGRAAPEIVAAARLPRGLRTGVTFGPRLLCGIRDAMALFRRVQPAGVVALGGWPCVPTVLAARLMGVPLAFVVADVVPGLVVRKLARFAGRIYVPVAEAGAALPSDRVVVSGPLLRAGLAGGTRDPARFGLHTDRATLLVFGGSLGAQGLYERWLLGLTQAVVENPGLAARLQVIHAVGNAGDGVASAYARRGIAHHVVPFLDDMATAYATADLALTRGGANTCAELLATRTPAVVVPYPHHADRQQFANAAPLVEAGLALVIEEDALTPSRVETDVVGRLLDPGALGAMRDASGSATQSGAADQTADDLIRFLGLGTPSRESADAVSPPPRAGRPAHPAPEVPSP